MLQERQRNKTEEQDSSTVIFFHMKNGVIIEKLCRMCLLSFNPFKDEETETQKSQLTDAR